MRAFRDSLANVSGGLRIFATDISRLAPALHFSDRFFIVPACTDVAYIPTLIQICNEEKIDLIIPTIDTELPILSRFRPNFTDVGCLIAISSAEAIEISGNKTLTNEFFRANGIPTVKQFLPSEFPADLSPSQFIAKPKSGSASKGVFFPTSQREISALATDYIIEERAFGQEITVNVFVNSRGQCINQLPHRRIEVRAGEVSKGITFRHERIMQLAKLAAETLPGAFGALCFQCFYDPTDESIRFFEINARFGGGYPLAFKAGADYPRWLYEETRGGPVTETHNDWQSSLFMTRYDEAIYVVMKDIGDTDR